MRGIWPSRSRDFGYFWGLGRNDCRNCLDSASVAGCSDTEGQARPGGASRFQGIPHATEADKLSRGVQVRDGQLQFENYSAYAVALEVERGWGEEFATQLMQTVEFDHAYSFSLPPIDIDAAVPQDHFLQLNLRRKQEPSEKT